MPVSPVPPRLRLRQEDCQGYLAFFSLSNLPASVNSVEGHVLRLDLNLQVFTVGGGLLTS